MEYHEDLFRGKHAGQLIFLFLLCTAGMRFQRSEKYKPLIPEEKQIPASGDGQGLGSFFKSAVRFVPTGGML